MLHRCAYLWGTPLIRPLAITAKHIANANRNFAVNSSPVVRLFAYYRLKDISKQLKVPVAKIEKKLVVKRRKKYFCNFDSVWFAFSSTKTIIIPYDTAKLLCDHYKKDTELIPPLEANSNITSSKLPVIAFLGHFNHGKTTLLDTLAGSDFISGEKHFITQVIRTKGIQVGDKLFTVVDTPGQDIFFRMRNYGAAVADLVVLLVAVDDGVCSQTEESIGVAEELGCPVIVCLNKCDLPIVKENPNRIAELTSELREYKILANADIVPISAIDKSTLDEFNRVLLEKTEHLQMKDEVALDSPPSDESNRQHFVRNHGTVLNSWSSASDGVVLHVVLREGKISPQDWFSSGGWAGSICAIELDGNKSVQFATAGMAVKIRVVVKHRFDPDPLAESIYFIEKHHALHHSEQRAMEYSLASYAIPPSDAKLFRLMEYATHTLQFEQLEQRGEVSIKAKKNRWISEDQIDLLIKDQEENDDDSIEEQDDSVVVEGLGVVGSKNNEGDESTQDPRKCVVVKADTTVSLGTMYDALVELEDRCLQDSIAERDSAIEYKEKEERLDEKYLNSKRIVRGGIGVVSIADVMVAVAAEGPILTYNVTVDPNAARLAQSKQIAILKYDKMQDVIDVLLGHRGKNDGTS